MKKNETFLLTDFRAIPILVVVGFLFIFQPSALSNNIELISNAGKENLSVTQLLVNGDEIWVGSLSGMFLYKGQKTQEFSVNNGLLKNDFITSIARKKEILAASTWGGGVFLRNIETKQSVNILGAKLKNKERCGDILFENNRILYTVCDNSLYQISLKSDLSQIEVTQLLEIPGVLFTEMLIPDNKTILLGTQESGLYILNSDKQEVHKLSFNEDRLANVNSLELKDKSTVLISTSIGLYQLRLSDLTLNKILFQGARVKENAQVLSTNCRDFDNCFVSTSGNGAFVLTAIKNDEMLVGLSYGTNNQLRSLRKIKAIAKTASEETLIGTPNGLYIIPPLEFEIKKYIPSSENYNRISELKNINNEIFLADDSRVFKLNIRNSSINAFTTNHGYVLDLIDYDKESMLISTLEKGLLLIDFDGRVINEIGQPEGLPRFNKSEYSKLLKSPNEDVYIGTFFGKESGLYKGRLGERFTKLIDKIFIEEISFSENNELIILSAFNGIFVEEIGGFRRIIPKDIKNYHLNCLERVNDNLYAICSRQNGVFLLDLNKSTLESLQLPNNAIVPRKIRDINKDEKGDLWIFSNIGLSYLKMKDLSLFNFEVEDGLSGRDFPTDTTLKIGVDKVLVPSLQGLFEYDLVALSRFAETKMSRESFVSEIIINPRDSSLSIEHNDDSHQQDYAQFPSDFGSLEFDLNHNNFEDRHSLQFEVKLEGVQSDWQRLPLGQDSITYHALRHGNYVFNARVHDPRSLAKQPIAQKTFIILPPWWKSLYAYAFYLLFSCLFLFLIHRYRVRHIRERNHILEKTVKDRTATIENLLVQKQVFFENISHELRTPLTLIMGPLETTLEQMPDDKNRTNLSLVAKNVRRLKFLVEQVLDLAKTGHPNKHAKKVYNYKTTIEFIAQSFSSALASNKSEIHVEGLEAATGELQSDSLEKILLNILSNSIKYGDSSVRVTISGVVAGKSYIITISDNGPGISKADKNRIFDRYCRLVSGTSSGSGIGLALVSELVKNNSGDIFVSSKTELGNSGTTIEIQLPISSKEVSDDTQSFEVLAPFIEYQQTSMFDSSSMLERSKGSGHLNLLIAEDNIELGEFLLRELSQYFDCTLAVNGEIAYTKAINAIPDLIISDVLMPKLDGYGLTRKLREESATSHIPIILLTAKDDQQSRMKGWSENVDDFIGKPFNISELKVRINRILVIREILKKRFASELANNLAKKDAKPISFQSKKDIEFFEKFEKIVEMHYPEETFNRSFAAEKLAMSERQLNRKLAALVDYNFSEYLRKYRLQRAKDALLAGKQITQIAYDVGFSSASYFTSCFRSEYELSPKQFIQSSETKSKVITKLDE